jgi:hypothetical protein
VIDIQQVIDKAIREEYEDLESANLPREDYVFHLFNEVYLQFLIEEGLSLEQIRSDEVSLTVLRKRLLKFFSGAVQRFKDDLPLKYRSKTSDQMLSGFLTTMGFLQRRNKRFEINPVLKGYQGISKNKNRTLTFTYLGQVAVIALIFMIRHTCKGLTSRDTVFFSLVRDSLERILTIDLPSLREPKPITMEAFNEYRKFDRPTHETGIGFYYHCLATEIRDLGAQFEESVARGAEAVARGREAVAQGAELVARWCTREDYEAAGIPYPGDLPRAG